MPRRTTHCRNQSPEDTESMWHLAHVTYAVGADCLGFALYDHHHTREKTSEGESAMALAKAEPGKTRIGWIGTGVMGQSMCRHVMAKGYSATVFNRTKAKAQPLLDAGASYADSPKAVA